MGAYGAISVDRLQALSDALRDTRAEAAGPDRERARASRRAQGAYFTPAPLVEFLAGATLAARLDDGDVAWRDDGSPVLRVLDPCAGDGRFLSAAADDLCRRAEQRGVPRELARPAIERACLIGVERDPEFAALARARLPGAAVHGRDALIDPPAAVRGVDVVLGNPPYVRSIHMPADERARLHGRWRATSFGEWDLYAAFIEQAFEWLAPRGRVGLVVPSRWFTAAFAGPLRDKLAAAGAVRALVDFGADQVFADATTYTALVCLERPGSRRARASTVRIARRMGGTWRVADVPAARLGRAPWLVTVNHASSPFAHAQEHGLPLGRVARVVKGVGTNADPVYLLERAVVRGPLVRAHSRAAGREVELEAAACKPCARGRDIDSYGAIAGALRCVWPYGDDGQLLGPDELAARYPLTAGYLATWRERLSARERGKYADERYYRFGRPQNLAFMTDRAPKLAVPDVVRHGRALLDTTGAVLIDSAYGVRLLAGAPPGYPLELLLAVLNSPVLRVWLVLTGIPLRGGYVRAKSAYLDSLPLPPISPATGRVTELVRRELDAHGRVRAAAAIDDAVRAAYAIDAALWRELAEY